jgi:hypothetical protein
MSQVENSTHEHYVMVTVKTQVYRKYYVQKTGKVCVLRI